jgi:glycosyltransferase involved in cell wall biosynthesis
MPLKILKKKDLKMIGNELSNPLVSVIIPNYNHAPYLKERIDSVLNQSYRNFEVILLDDCSIDNSRDIIESYRGQEKIVHIEFNQTNSGSTFKQWQKGLELTKGEWIWIAESDDVAHLDFLKELSFELVSSNSLIFCKSLIIDEFGAEYEYLGCDHFPNKKYLNVLNEVPNKLNSIDFLTQEMFNFNQIVNASSVIFQKSMAGDLDYIAEHFKLCGDWMFWVSLIDKAPCNYSDKGLNYFRAHRRSVRTISNNRVFTFFENAQITRFIYTKHPSKKLKNKYFDYLIYIYFNRYDSSARQGTFTKFLNEISFYGPKAIIESFKQKIKNG